MPEDPNRVRVYLRLKPGNEKNSQLLYKIAADEKQMSVVNSIGHFDREKWFTFDRILHENIVNKQVYQLAGKNLVDDVLNGFNCSLFAYGQTGSGKTHTLMSSDGVTAYMVSRIFSQISRDPYNQYKVTCSYLQIYQEHIYDLLNSNPKLEFRLKEDPREGIYIENMSTYACHSPNDVYKLLNIGRKRLIIAETKMNRYSSRSHAVCQIIVRKRTKNLADAESICSSRSETTSFPEIKVDRALSSTTPPESPPLPFKRPVLKKHHTYSEMNWVLKKDVENAPPCNLSDVKPRTAEIKKTSMIPISRTNVNTQRSKTPDYSKRRPVSSTPRTSLSADPHKNYTRSLSSTSLKQNTSWSSSLSSRHGKESPRSSTVNSCESLADSLSDSEQWYMRESHLDISKMEDDEVSDITSLHLNLRPLCDEYVNLRGKLSIIDLAGSERTNRTQAQTKQIKEAKNINVSLFELGNVIAALSEKKKHVPYRNSKLTRLLQDSLGGNCKTSFVLCVSPSAEDFVETQNTLQFGQRLMKLTTKPNINTEPDYKGIIADLKDKMKESEVSFEMKIEEYEDELKTLRNENRRAESELYKQGSLSRLLKDEYRSSQSKQDEIQDELGSLKAKMTSTEKLLCDREREIGNLKLDNQLLRKKNDELIDSERTLRKQMEHQKFDVGTNTESSYKEDDYRQHVLENRTKELQDLNKEYQTLLKENEQLKLGKKSSSCKDQVTCTSPVHSFDVSTNTEVCRNPEFERLRNFLLAEVMSLQLLYSMFDLKTRTQIERESLLGGAQLVNDSSKIRREKGATVSSLSTPSGYETGSHMSQNSLSETFTDEKRALLKTTLNSSDSTNLKKGCSFSSEYFNFLSSPQKSTANDCAEVSVPKTGTLLEEVIEAQRSGSCLLSSSSTASANQLPMETRVVFLKKEIGQQKKSVEEELSRVSALHLGLAEQGGRLHKREVYSNLVHGLSHEEFYKHYSLDSLEQILNLVLVDHSLTGCLLALSHKTKTSTINMIRRLSSYKSTNQKPLLDYSYIDQEFYGYENEACNVFQNDDSDDLDPVQCHSVSGNMNYGNGHDNLPSMETRPVQNDNAKHFHGVGVLALDSDNETSSDSDVDSPVAPKKGLRRFFCMPKKTMKPSTPLSSSIGSSVRRSFRRSKKKEASLMDFEQ